MKRIAQCLQMAVINCSTVWWKERRQMNSTRNILSEEKLIYYVVDNPAKGFLEWNGSMLMNTPCSITPWSPVIYLMQNITDSSSIFWKTWRTSPTSRRVRWCNQSCLYALVKMSKERLRDHAGGTVGYFADKKKSNHPGSSPRTGTTKIS